MKGSGVMGIIKMEKKTEVMTLFDAMELFVKSKKAANLSERTIDYYRDCVDYFSEFYHYKDNINELYSKCLNGEYHTREEKDIFLKSIICKDVCYDDYISFINFLQEKDGIRDETINSYLRGVRCFFNFCMKLGYMQRFDVKVMKIDKTFKEPYTNEEIAKMIKELNMKECTFAEYRTWAMINFILATGLRLSSVLELKIDDIILDECMVMVSKTKGRRKITLPLTPTIVDILKHYLDIRGGEKSDYLFPNQYGKKFTVSGAESALEKYNASRGIGKTSFHLLRHTFAKLWVLNGGDIFHLQKFLDHKTMDMVRQYVNIYGTDLQRQNLQCNPLDKLYKETNNYKTLKMVKK